ncbi:MAG: diaminopimelate decarboxylase [Pseudomonadota bacterium]|nr:diaminopimelate decarboxylase [Pseudomonadota bacterium]MEC9076533.1 diaminopimelate decarboxylase [Pseudomonadota bacterium]
MDHFQYRDGALFAEDVSVSNIASQFGTPCFIYSKASLIKHLHAYAGSLSDISHLICYGMKANSNLAVLQILAKEGAGFDIVSIGELERVIKAGGDPAKVVFSGVGKQDFELRRALEVGIHCFNVESLAELEHLNAIATKMGKIAPVSLRINPDVDPKTHPYISTGLKANKFGIAHEDAIAAYRLSSELPGLSPVGIDCHIGSQLTDVSPLIESLDKLLALIDQLADIGIQLKHIDLGGGLGVTYDQETPPHPSEYLALVKARLAGRDLTLVLEPGRSIAANAGIFVTKTILTKTNQDQHFAIVDGAMNDLIRPSLYGAWQNIVPVDTTEKPHQIEASFDIVGPVCESGDFLGKARRLRIQEGDLLAVRSAGAYGFVMGSNYNTRGRAPEILVDKNQVHLIRERETIDSLWALEHTVDD